MSKASIIGVIVLMTISLFGMIGLQLYWISDAIQVKQEQFDRSVHEALARVVEKLETQEAVSAVASGMASLQHVPDQTTYKMLPVANSATENTSDTPNKATPAPPVRQAIPRDEHQAKAKSNPKSKAKSANTTSAVTYYGQTGTGAGSQSFRIEYKALDSMVQHLLPPALHGQGFPIIPAEQLRHMAAWQGLPLDSLRSHRHQLDANNMRRIRRLADSAVSYTRQINGRNFRISVDTLQYIALHMDSLRHQHLLNQALAASEIASINVRKDSVLILKKGAASRFQETSREIINSSGGKITFSNIHRPEDNRSTQDAATRIIVRPSTKQTHSIPADAPQKTNKPVKTTSTLATSPDPAKVEAKKEKLNNVVEKMVVEYVAKDVPLEQRLNLGELKPMLQSELQDKGICLDFGYWVLSNQQDTITVAHLPNNSTRNFATYKASLFPNDIFDKSDYLAVYFPDSRAYAIRSLWMMLASSALFTLIMVATFGTTIHIIFRQKKLSDMKNDFINNMTHEFKTPIATISLATDSITNPKIYSNPEKIKYYTDIIRQENKRMNVQVENVLQIAQLEKNDYRMNLQTVDLHHLICKAVESIRLQIEERSGKLTTRLQAPETELQLDEVHFYNVICNLLDNANKYSPSSPDILLETQNVAGGMLLAVEDNGLGMTRDTQLRVFDKFYRVPTGNLHNVKGFGLGLSYVKAIVKAHNGSIKLQSEPGKGSRFEIFLPFVT
ncbi:HAMP domain-containing sensor histidine kinase [uncultured Pontibacter sp.]|uniref:sensor histidine kinase n=1 Tax=uncultured Pontibacter sp. TaxID=453356 RepID=UPI00261DE9EE|nr:HAMP domain-containing sensor histidine kinase [uncultured Pontibacter sp.]